MTATATFAPGTVVRTARRTGLVLSEFRPGHSDFTPGDSRNAYLVWFYGTQGPARDTAVQALHSHELVATGSLEDLSERLLRRIDVGLGFGATFHSGVLRGRASLAHLRKRAARRGF